MAPPHVVDHPFTTHLGTSGVYEKFYVSGSHDMPVLKQDQT